MENSKGSICHGLHVDGMTDSLITKDVSASTGQIILAVTMKAMLFGITSFGGSKLEKYIRKDLRFITETSLDLMMFSTIWNFFLIPNTNANINPYSASVMRAENHFTGHDTGCDTRVPIVRQSVITAFLKQPSQDKGKVNP
jgi:hypothetical protein